MFLPNTVKGTDGQIQTTTNAPSYVMAGIGYDGTSLCIDTGAVASTDVYVGGVRVTSAGAIRCYDASGGLPAGAQYQCGIAATNTGQLCYNNASVSSAVYVNGFPLTADGRLFVSAGAIVVNYASAETPSGLINGANTTYTLAHTPNPALSLRLFLNGLLQVATVDYTLATATITMTSAPLTGASLIAFYRY